MTPEELQRELTVLRGAAEQAVATIKRQRVENARLVLILEKIERDCPEPYFAGLARAGIEKHAIKPAVP